MSSAGEIAINIIIPILTGAVMLAVSVGLGAVLVKTIFRENRPGLVECFALGTLAISLLTFIWGLLGAMGTYSRLTLGIPLFLIGLYGLIRIRPVSPFSPGTFNDRVVIALAVLIASCVLIRIFPFLFNPPFGWDECSYHLPASKALVETGRFTFHPEINVNAFPQNTEMLYAWAIAYSPLSSAHFVSYLAYIFSLLAVIRLGKNTFSEKIGWLAATFMAAVPGLQYCGVHAYIDIWVLFYILAGGMIAFEGVKEENSKKILLAGVFFGAAAGVKYTALIGAATLFPALFCAGNFRAFGLKPVRARTIFGAIGLAILVASPWYIKNIVWFANPFFPLLTGLFGKGGGIYGMYAGDLAFRPKVMLEKISFGFFSESGTLWRKIINQWPMWISLPTGIWFLRRNPLVRVILVWTVLSWIVWVFFAGGVIYYRYHFYLLPFNVLIFAYTASLIFRFPFKKIGKFIFQTALVIFFAFWFVFDSFSYAEFFPPLDSAGRTGLLESRMESYRIVSWANKIIPRDETAVGIWCEDSRLYANFRLLSVWDCGWGSHTAIADACTSPEDLAELLHTKFGADYLIIYEPKGEHSGSVVVSKLKELGRMKGFKDYFELKAGTDAGAIFLVKYPESDEE